MVPDIVFNPHGFPSRMTIAMMVECMAGKSGAGICTYLSEVVLGGKIFDIFFDILNTPLNKSILFSSRPCS